MIPYQLEPVEFKINKLWDIETKEEIEAISPGVKGQQVLIDLPIECKKDLDNKKKKSMVILGSETKIIVSCDFGVRDKNHS